MTNTIACPKCGREQKIEIKDFCGIEIALCENMECETFFVVSWKSDVTVEVLEMEQPIATL